MTIGRQNRSVTYVDATDSGGIAIRYWLPRDISGAVPLIIWSHPDSQNEQITPGYWAYPLIQAFLQEGYAVIGSNIHNRSWGNTASLTDIVNAYNFMTGKVTVSKVVMAGASMGGLASLLTIAKGNLPAGMVKGAVLVDGVTNLANMYNAGLYASVIQTAYGMTSSTLSASSSIGAATLSSSTSFPATTVLTVDSGANQETVTVSSVSGAGPYTLTLSATATKAHASGVSIFIPSASDANYATATTGNDPNLYAASAYAGIRYRFYASAADTSVARASNADAFVTLVSGTATEAAAASHPLGHLDPHGVWPADVIAFVKRCFV